MIPRRSNQKISAWKETQKKLDLVEGKWWSYRKSSEVLTTLNCVTAFPQVCLVHTHTHILFMCNHIANMIGFYFP